MIRRIGTGFAAQLVSLAVTFADRIVLVGVLLRVWGTDVYSDWATLVAGAGLISFGELGLNIYFGNGLQSAFAQGDEIRFQRLIGNSLFTYLVLGGALAGLAALFALTIDLASSLSLGALEPREATAVFLLLGATNVLRVMRGSISQIYRGRGQFATGIMVDAVFPAAVVVLVSGAAQLGAGTGTVAVVYLVADLLFGWGMMMFVLRQKYPSLHFRLVRPTRPEIHHILSRVKWFGLLQGAPVLWLQVPVLVIGALSLSGAALVSFVVARTLVNFARQIAAMLSQSTAVEAANAFHVGDTSALARILSTFGGFLSGLSGAVAGGLVAFGAPIITFWTGKPETVEPLLILWLLAPSLLVVPAMPLSAVLTLGNLPRPVGLASLFQLGLGLVLCYLLAQRFGVVGAAAGLGIGEAVAVGVLLPVLASRHAGLDYSPYLLRCVVVFSLSAIWGCTVGSVLIEIVGATRIELFLLSLCIWGIIGLAPVVALALPASQRARVVGTLFAWTRAWFVRS